MDLILLFVALCLFIGRVVVVLALVSLAVYVLAAFKRKSSKYDNGLRYFGPKDKP